MNGSNTFIPRVLSLNGKSGWASTVRCLSPPNSAGILWTPAPTLGVASSRNVAFYKCKHCDRVEPSSCASFQYNDLDRNLKCENRNCGKTSKVRDWSCACEEYWFTCAQHAKHVSQGSQPTRSHEQATGRTANSESSTRRAPKEPAHDCNALFQEDPRRGRKRPLAHSVITLSDSAGPPQRQLNMVLS